MQRRQGRVPSVVVALIAVIGFVLFLGQIFAQEPVEPVPEEMPAGEMGMPAEMGPGAGGRAPSGPLRWTDETMDEELTMTYDEFLVRERLAGAPLPRPYLFDENDEPKRCTPNEWYQLHRIYAQAREEARCRAEIGRPGGTLAMRVATEIAVKEAELSLVRELYEQGLGSFWFEIGYPQMRSQDIRPGITGVPVEVGVVMRVKSGVAQRYPSLVYRKLKKYDNYGVDRSVFHIVDYEGGMWNPKIIRLWDSTITEWNDLWSANQVELNLYDSCGNLIVSARQAAGLDGRICTKLVYPDELNYNPLHEVLIPPKDRTFEGGHLNLDYKKGWYYNFSFTIPLDQLSLIERAEAVLIGAENQRGSRSATQAAPPSPEAGVPAGSRPAMEAGTGAAMDTARTMLPAMRQQVPPLVTPF